MNEPMEFSSIRFFPVENPVDGGFVGRVVVFGANIPITGSALQATIGEVNVEQTVVSPGGHGFSGFVREEPADGASLSIRIGAISIETDIQYDSGGPPIS